MSGHRERVADFWDKYLDSWCRGVASEPDPLPAWKAAYSGTGRGAIDLDHCPDPYVGDLRGLRGNPRLVVLGLNPGVGYDQLQGRDGTWTRRIAAEGYSYCLKRSPAEDPESWIELHGKPSRYWKNLETFARRWFDDSAAGHRDIVNFELYPWHSVGITGAMAPPPTIVQQFVWDPVSELDVDVVFAFGTPWFQVCHALAMPVVIEHGKAAPVPGHEPWWRLSMFRLDSGQLVVVSAQLGYSGPPGRDRVETLKSLVKAHA